MSKKYRKHPRIQLKFKVKIRTKHKGLHDVKDLSLGGLFIQTARPSMFQEGDEIRLFMHLPIENGLKRLDARVARVTENGIGVEFRKMKPEDRVDLERCFSLATLASPFEDLIVKREAIGTGSEKRRHPRVDFQFQVKIKTIHKGLHEVRNLSLGGLFIETIKPSLFRKGDEIELVMREPADNKLMRLDARVARTTEDGIGVEFLNISPEDETALEACFDLFRHTMPMFSSG